MAQVSLQVIPVAILYPFAPVVIINEFKMLAGFPTQGQIDGLGFIQRDVL